MTDPRDPLPDWSWHLLWIVGISVVLTCAPLADDPHQQWLILMIAAVLLGFYGATTLLIWLIDR